MAPKVRGRISVHPRGFGFMQYEAEDGTPWSAFVTPPDLNRLLDGDLVEAEVSSAEPAAGRGRGTERPTSDPGRITASAITLIERRREELFGTLVRRSGQAMLRVDRLVANTDWPFDPKRGPEASAPEGTPIVARIRGQALELARVLPATADLALERCIVRHGVRATFSDAALAEAREAAKRTPSRGRRDLRDVPTVTIDAASTRDIDDALAVFPPAESTDGAVRVLVSIADVDAFVAEGSALDTEARARGTSVYLAGRVLPMLPESLSHEAASLVPNVDRPALTVEMRIDPEGLITAVDVYESVIRSSARLTYDAVATLLSRGASPEVPPAVVGTLRWLRTAAARLSTIRAARGGIELAREEAHVTLDEAGAPLDVSPREDTEAHRIVERLMVAANECVARWLVERGLPGIFRVHDPPTEDRVEALARFAHHFGVEAGFGRTLTPRGLAAFDAQLRDAAFAPAVRTVMGRVLGVARYTSVPGLHFGLGAPLYLHFTSPIRRYADLAVHRVVKRFLSGERAFVGAEARHAELATFLDRATRQAAKAEVERHRMLVARLFAGRIGERLAGNVVAVQPFGLVVQMLGTGVTGTVALELLPDGPHRVNLAEQAVVPVSGEGQRTSVGDPIEVVVAGANEELGRIELAVTA